MTTSFDAMVTGFLLMQSGLIGEPSTEQAWVTGQVLGVDGGLSRVRSRA